MKVPEAISQSTGVRKLNVLLTGESRQGSSHLAARLRERGCECQFAGSFEEASSLLQSGGFHLVLSATRVRDSSLLPLIGLLENSGVTLFYFQAVEDNCWWFPALRRGQRCFGSCALRPSEFVSALDEAIEQIRSGRDVGDRARLYPVNPSKVAGPVVPLSGRSASSIGQLRVNASTPAKRKVG
jgi:hypothetical protein